MYPSTEFLPIARGSSGQTTLLNWGSYDVDNFGDLLFPFLVEHFLGSKYDRVVHLSPTGIPPVWRDARSTLTVRDVVRGVQGAQLVVGGGNLISWSPSGSVNYAANAPLSKVVHSSFAWVPYVLRVKYGVPYAFNLVGVARAIPKDKHDITRLVLDSSAFISCREASGVRHLQAIGVSKPIILGIDPAIDISRVFSRSMLVEHFYRHVVKKYHLPDEKRLVVIHINSKYFNDHFDALHAILLLLHGAGLHPVLIPLSLGHRDDRLLADDRLAVPLGTIVQRPDSLLDVLSILARAEYYVGSSLHGGISSLSYGNRALFVANEMRVGFSKFSDFLDHVSLPENLYPSWKHLLSVLSIQGLGVFRGLSSEAVGRIAERPSVWEYLWRHLQRKSRVPKCFPLDPSLLRLAHEHYGI